MPQVASNITEFIAPCKKLGKLCFAQEHSGRASDLGRDAANALAW
jgi:hypothetical protein